MNTPVNFEIAKLLKEKEFDGEYASFYVKPSSKVFGIDEHGRTFPVTYTPKKLYHCGEHAALNKKSVYLAPTIADVVMWVLDKHKIWIQTDCGKEYWFFRIRFADNRTIDFQVPEGVETALTGLIFSNTKYLEYKTPTEAYLEAIKYTLTDLI